MKRYFFFLYVVSFLMLEASLAFAGSTTLTTYYPAPNGNYNLVDANNVGIGLATPLSVLHVRGSQISAFTGTARGMLTINGAYTAGYYTPIDFLYNDSAYPNARIAAYFDGSGSKLMFGTSNNYSSGITNTAMTIDPSGNVGIGVAAPVTPLNLYGSSGSTEFHIHDNKGSGGVGGSLAKIGFSIVNGSHNMGNGSETAQIVVGANAATYGTMDFYAYNDASPVMHVEGTGNVGIGTTTPTATLAVNGTLESTGAVITIYLSACGGGCAGSWAINTWYNFGAYGWHWGLGMNSNTDVFTHNGTGVITVNRAGVYRITENTFGIPASTAGYLAYGCPYINGGVNCGSFTPGTVSPRFSYDPAGYWAEGETSMFIQLTAGSTVSYGAYYDVSQSYWGYDGYTYLEIERIN